MALENLKPSKISKKKLLPQCENLAPPKQKEKKRNVDSNL